MQLLEQCEQRFVGKPAVSRQPDTAWADVLKDQLKRSFDNGSLVAVHPSFEHALLISAPVNGNRAPTDGQRNDEQVLVVFSCPINGEADFTKGRNLAQRLVRDTFGQPPHV